MSHLDAVLFALETPTNHMNLGLLGTFTAPDAGVDVAAVLRQQIGPEAKGYNSLRLVLRQQLGGLASPMLVDGGPIDLNYHVREVELDEPTDQALDAWVSHELSIPIDRSKPLWHVTVVKGMPDGGFALFVKGHHGVFDGVAALRVALQVFANTPLRKERRRPIKMINTRSTVESVGELVTWPARVVRVLADNSRHLVKLSHIPPSPRPFSAPRTSLNKSISSSRAVARTVLPLAVVADVRRSASCTANDVAIGVVATSVRKLLKERKGLPKESLVALVPAAQSGSEWGKRSGNRLSFWFVSMETDVSHPVERLRSIAESSKSARDVSRLRGADLWERYAGAALPGPLNWSMRVLEKLRLMNHVRPHATMIISNITGPRNTVTLAGATMTAVWPFGPPKDGGAVNVTMVSYGDTIYVGLQGDISLAESLKDIAAEIPAALAELEGSLVG